MRPLRDGDRVPVGLRYVFGDSGLMRMVAVIAAHTFLTMVRSDPPYVEVERTNRPRSHVTVVSIPWEA